MELKVIASDLGFAEGPLWHPQGYLLFSDVLQNRIMKWQDEKLEVFLENSGMSGKPTENHHEQIGANGITIDSAGRIVFCRHGSHSVARLESDGTVVTLIESYEGKRLNSPNDLCIGPDGSIYFTDPPYGLKDQVLMPSLAQPSAGLYRWKEGKLRLLVWELQYPNGVCFSPDFRYLYLGTNKEQEKGIRRYRVVEGDLQDGEVFVLENADGMKTDDKGNLFLATMQGVKVVSPEGEVIRRIETPEMATNLCFGGNYLYITTPSTVYQYYLKNLDL